MKKLLTLLFLTFTFTFSQIHSSPADFIYSGGQDGTVRKIDSSGNEVWSFTNHTSIVWGVSVDANGFVYSVSNDTTVRKIDPNGNQVWVFGNHSNPIYGVTVDENGNVYSGGFGGTLRKIDSSGNQVWAFTGHTATINKVAVDPDGNVYTASSDETVRKIDSTGNQVWSFTEHTSQVNSVTVDKDGFVYSGSLDGTVRKIDPSGNEVWSFTNQGTVRTRDIAVDNDGFVYIGADDNNVRKINPSGNQVWVYSGHSSGIHGIAVDEDGFVYSSSADEEVHKLDSNGNFVWAFTGHVGIVRGLEVYLEFETEPPEYNVELQTNTPYNDFIYQDDEVNVTTDSVITTILNDESFTVTSTAQSTGSYTFNNWYDLDNMEVFTTDRNFTIEDPNRDYNLIADYTLDSFNTFNIDSNLPSPQDFTFNTITLENEVYSFNQTEFNNYQHPDDRDWEIVAPINNIGFYEFDYYYDNDANDIYDFNHIITGSGFSPPNLTAVYSLPEEYQINLIIESGIGDIIFQHGENDPISGPFISQTIGLGDDWTATAPNNSDFQFNFWFDLNDLSNFSNNKTINISNTNRDYYLEALYLELVEVNWDSAGGTPIPQQKVIIGSSVQPPPEPTRPGFVFDYWEDSDNNEVIFPKNISEDVTFTAVWIDTYSLTYDTNGGGLINPDTYLENEVPEVVTPSRFGYEFDGWYTDDGTFQNEYDFTDPITVDTTIHAKWQFGSDRDASLSLTTFLDDNDLGDGFSQIIIMTALYILINVMIYVYSGPLVVTLILNFILSSIFLILGWIPMWIIIVIFIGLFGFIYLSSSGRGAME